MANDDFARGFVPLNSIIPGVNAHYYRASTASDIFIGQPIQGNASGFFGVTSNAAIQPTIIGVAVGFAGPQKAGLATDDPFLDASDLTTLAANLRTGDRWILVADDPQQQFFIQEDTGGTALALADVGAAIDLIYRTFADSGNTTSGIARLEIDASTVVTTTAAVVHILGLHDNINNDGTDNAVGDYAKWRVKFLHHGLAGAANAAPIV